MHGNRILRVQRGGFIEDKLGQMQRKETEQDGVPAHRRYVSLQYGSFYVLRNQSPWVLILALLRYGTWILDDRAQTDRSFPALLPTSASEAIEQRPGELIHNDAVGTYFLRECAHIKDIDLIWCYGQGIFTGESFLPTVGTIGVSRLCNSQQHRHRRAQQMQRQRLKNQ